MIKLRNKIFYTIFLIISLFLITITLFIDIQSYNREYKNILNNLTRINRNFIDKPKIDKFNFNNKLIMDYNIYSFILDKNNNIIHSISHSELDLNNDILNKVNDIIKINKQKLKINNLYINNYAYNYIPKRSLIIIDITSIKNRLLSFLTISISLLILFEILTFYISKKITNWIIKPVEESFLKQKEFIANASHELKTPLSVIIASIDCLDINKKNEKWLNNIKSESDRMNNLITRLLDLSKTESIDYKESFELNNISKIIEKRILIFESLAYENKLEIKSNIEKDIMFNSNKNDIDELISILIDNAIKHSYKDTYINVNLYKNNNNIIIDVINNGDNISKEDIDKIFERFYRSDKSRNRNSNRYGLGLAIAKNIVNNHNGDIKVISENNYTTFKIIFKK